MRATAKVVFNKSSALTTIRGANDKALTDTGNQAIKDTDQYVPEDQNELIGSGHSNSDMQAKNGKFHLRWSTPYARYLFKGEVMYGNPTNRTYGPKKISFTKAMAKMEWAKYAAKVHKDDWRAVYQASLKRRLKD